MGKLGAAYVEISATLDKFHKGVKSAKAETNKFLRDINKTLGVYDFSPLIKNIGLIGLKVASITAPLTATYAAMFGLAKMTANLGEELDKMSQKTGISVGELYALKNRAELADLSLYEMGFGLRILSQNIVEARDQTTEMSRVFKALEIDTSKPLIDIFTQLATKFSEFRDGEDKLTLATKLFGRAGQEIIPLLNDIAKNGLKVSDVFTEQTAKAASEFNDRLKELKQQSLEVGYSIGNELIPKLTKLMETIKELNLVSKTTQGFGLWLKQFEALGLAGFAGKTIFDLITSKAKEAKTAVDDLGLSGLGVTKMKDLPFLFGGEAFQPKKSVPIIPEKEKEKKTDEREAIRTAKAISDAYADMYEALKFNSRNYYEYQRGLLEKRREEEIEITGDIELAWQAFNARMQELEEQRLANSQNMLDGVRLFYAEMKREGFTWAQATKDAMTDAQQGMSSTFFQGWKNMIKGEQSFKDSFFGMIEGVADAWIDAVLRMMSQWQSFQTMRGIGSFFGLSPYAPQGESGAQALYGHDGGYVRSFHRGGLASDEIPAVLQAGEYVMSRRGVAALDKINNGNIGKPNMNVSINVENQTGQQVSMENQGARFDGERYVVNVILKNLNSNGALRNAFAGLK